MAIVDIKTGKPLGENAQALNTVNKKCWSRRDIIKGGLAGIIAAGVSPSLCGSITRGIGYRNLAGRMAAMGGGNSDPYHGYISDGLIAYWDGIDNTGNGDAAHDNNATQWVDLVGGKGNMTITQSIGEWEHDGLSFNRNSNIGYAAIILDFNNSDIESVEAVFIGEGNAKGRSQGGCGAIFSIFSNGTIKFATLRTGENGCGFGASNYITTGNIIITNNQKHSISIRRGVLATLDGRDEFVDSGIVQVEGIGMFIVGDVYNAYNGRFGKGKIMCLRMYSRILTIQNVAHNYAIDKARFNLP